MQKNPYAGKFIVFEGLDGSGQSTQANLLKDFLLEKNFNVILTKEPTQDSEAGKKIRKILDKKAGVQPLQLQKLFAQDRKEHLENIIIPALKEGKIVISDRYFFSSFAYGSASGVNLEWLIKINDEFLLPNLTFILKVSPKICLGRIKKRGDKITLFEEKKELEKVWEVYKILPKLFENVYPVRKSEKKLRSKRKDIDFFNGVYIINGEKPINEVFEEVKNLAHSKLNL
ncbi:MAG: dTMP kinase [Candidatus Nealsonbacteria bacterium CG_4_9_14_0_2_um_filter_37_38]|uniref:Thymidylate kinase n=1 Tax=Candidatus Nealsonbacteria bacterium CG_4_10_14_0_8_um_filter_37_14 TaxID=1974684 RepID=A0A2M7R6U7_9BACT|nr:MAG: dTMP kinase [Candidatus Nealsonbacteria bacterium CG_4_8_14_3_um_filter_37_23]PIY88953.1 MAG: dTMP kinase [Candidatus Nealsonbacteria bacterium CG_4_10_14_0_8_um_filter_37_14]PJC51892.1 MAG: dTMP kinase [Candidatus Nealsonbacteria bacterium CG_4_9_14_0_2_um_filter_37_38]